MHRAVDSILFFITFGLGVFALAICTNALVQRNKELGHANEVSPPGVKLILSTNNLSMPGFACSTAATGIFINSLILFFHNFHLAPMTHFMRKIFFLTPLFLFLNTLLAIGSAIAISLAARNGRISVYATLGPTRLPTAVFDAQAKALGLSVYYWDKSYVRLMAIGVWPMIPFAIITTYLGYRYWQVERPSAQHGAHTPYDQPPMIQRQESMYEDKGEIQHVA